MSARSLALPPRQGPAHPDGFRTLVNEDEVSIGSGKSRERKSCEERGSDVRPRPRPRGDGRAGPVGDIGRRLRGDVGDLLGERSIAIKSAFMPCRS